jgi:hypothetical protein
MLKKIIVLLLTIIPLIAQANNDHDEYYEKEKKYVLLKKEADSFLSGYLMFIKKLQNCETHVFNYYNPLIHKEGKYEIFGRKKNNICVVYMNYNEIREFKCDLTDKDINNISYGRIRLIRNKSGFGELSSEEKEVYFNKTTCNRNNFKRKNNEVDIEELKKNIDNPALLNFLETFKRKN